MKIVIRDRILKLLKDSPKTTKEIQKAIPDKTNINLAATISNNQHIFLRLERGKVGLRNRDEKFVTGKPVVPGEFCLYKRLCNLLQDGPLTTKQIYKAMPGENDISIRSTINRYPNLFIRIQPGLFGRKGRDEHLAERYQLKKPSKTVRQQIKETRKKFIDEINIVLESGPKEFWQICMLLPERKPNAIQSMLIFHYKHLGNKVYSKKDF